MSSCFVEKGKERLSMPQAECVCTQSNLVGCRGENAVMKHGGVREKGS